jgi:tRNA nucleotidyltransferase/poly(A) polymerase
MSDDSLDRARRIAKAAREAGGRALIVGGWVRDRLMGHGNALDTVYRVQGHRHQASACPPIG